MKAFVYIRFIDLVFFTTMCKLNFNASIYIFLLLKNDVSKSPFVDKPEKFVYNFFVIRIKYN
jgi:hypothetical protein